MTQNFGVHLYQSILAREPDASGLAYWQQQIDDGQITEAELVQQFIDSAEFAAFPEPIARLYFTALDRMPDPAGFSFWVKALQAGVTLEEITKSLLDSSEYLQKHGQQTSYCQI